MQKICSIVGARPQFVKACPLSIQLRKSFREILIHTGQHYDTNMSGIFFNEMQIPKPDYNLNIGSGSHGKQTGAMISEIEEVLLYEKPDFVIVYGDTNSTLAGALAAAKLHIPVAHVEAGLRSFNNKMPEEINRILTDRLSSWLFVPSEKSVENLNNEGIHKNIFVVGDIMFDAILMFKELASKRKNHTEEDLTIKKYFLATIHRAENTDNEKNLKEIFDSLSLIDGEIIIPLHPRTNEKIKKYGITPSKNIKVINPVGYLDMIKLMENAKIILTDSGGIQKEAYYLNVPCITLRNETEWVETVQSGWNILTGIDRVKINKAVEKINEVKKLNHTSFYGDGRTAEKIAGILMNN